MKGNYNNIAPFYDLLSHLVFGNSISRAVLFLMDAIPANSSVLIIGGGTGQILEEISKKYRSGLQITYVDVSKKMISISKKRTTGHNLVVFINQSISDITFYQQFDVVITPFFFDNFSTDTAKVIFYKIDRLLKSSGTWLFADFQLSEENKLWQKLLLNLMYFFFKCLCGIEASRLPDTASLFKEYKYQQVSKQTFYGKFIYSSIYLKPDT